MQKFIKLIEKINYWSIILLPFALVISTGIMNVFITLVIGSSILKKILKKEWHFIKTPVTLPFLLFILVALISFYNTLDYRSSLKGIEKLFKYGLFFWACAEGIKDLKHLKRVIALIAFFVGLIGLDGIWQFITGRDFIHGHSLLSCLIHLPRVTASFSAPNGMAIYLAALTPLLFGLAFFYLKGWKKYLVALATVLGGVGIFLTFSAGAAIGFFTAVLFVTVVRKHKIILALILVALLVLPFIVPKNLKDWARKVNYNPIVFVCGPDRITLYATAANMIRQHPVIGVGVNTFSRNYGRYKLAKMEKYAPTSDRMYAHNNFLQTGAEVGLLGLGIFIWFLVALFRNGWQVYRKSESGFLKITALSLIACLVAFLINGLTETSLYNQVGVVFWFIVGLLLCLNKFPENKELT
jgi:O-antigen ligase